MPRRDACWIVYRRRRNRRVPRRAREAVLKCARLMSEHEVHEIQLNGKQLVFMFMAATVVSVVIFLCGVMVGRGVRQPDDVVAANAGIPIDSAVAFDDVGPGPAPAADTAPAPEAESLTYAKRLEAPAPVNEPVKPAPAPKPEVAPAVNEKPAAR